MSEIEIGELLESDLIAYRLVVQVTRQDECLLIMLNRPADSNLDYTGLTKAITARIKTLQVAGIHTLVLYSRVLGEYDVDWQTQLEFSSCCESVAQQGKSNPSNNETINTATLITPVPSQVEAIGSLDATTVTQEFKLSDYCFVRNRSLLTVEILPPTEKIALAVQSFHALPNSSKELILPILKLFFRSSDVLLTEQFDREIQQWFEQLTQFNDGEVRSASNWFSRYCFNCEKTMVEVMAVIEPEIANTATVQEDRESAIATEQTSATDIKTQSTQKRIDLAPTQTNIPKTRKTRSPWHLVLPVAWVTFTIIVITLAIGSVNPNELAIAACRNAAGKQEYCRLAVQLVGELTFHEVSQNAVPLTEDDKYQSLKNCQLLGIRAGKTLVEAVNTKNPIPSKFGEEVIPGIFIADVKQTNFKQADATVRTACVYTKTKTRVSLLNFDVIPNNWSDEPYKGKPIPQESLRKAMGIYSVLNSVRCWNAFYRHWYILCSYVWSRNSGLFCANALSGGILLGAARNHYLNPFLIEGGGGDRN